LKFPLKQPQPVPFDGKTLNIGKQPDLITPRPTINPDDQPLLQAKMASEISTIHCKPGEIFNT
jgi:hypothetical protein